MADATNPDANDASNPDADDVANRDANDATGAPGRDDSAEVREKPLGHYFDVITDGHGAMYGYASRIPPRDRWLIAAYLRALQLSQGVPVDQLSASDRQKLDESDREANTPKAAPEGEAEGREAHP